MMVAAKYRLCEWTSARQDVKVLVRSKKNPGVNLLLPENVPGTSHHTVIYMLIILV